MQEIEILESKIKLSKLILIEITQRIVDINLLAIKNFLKYLDYYLLISKVIITLIERGKLTNIRVTLNIRAEVSIIILDIVL